MAYSSDFRRGVIAACDRGMTTKQVAELFGVAPSWVRRLKQWRRERGSIEPRACGGSRPKLGPADEAVIHGHFAAHPDTTIVELRAALGTDVSEITVWRKARALGYRLKKVHARGGTEPARRRGAKPAMGRTDRGDQPVAADLPR